MYGLPLTICFLLLNTLCIVCYFYLKKSARCNGRNVVLQVFLLKNILRLLLYLLKFNLPLIVPEELMNFKLSDIPGKSVYINFTFVSYSGVSRIILNLSIINVLLYYRNIKSIWPCTSFFCKKINI